MALVSIAGNKKSIDKFLKKAYTTKHIKILGNGEEEIMNNKYELRRKEMCMNMCTMYCCMCKNIEPSFSCIHMPVPDEES